MSANVRYFCSTFILSAALSLYCCVHVRQCYIKQAKTWWNNPAVAVILCANLTFYFVILKIITEDRMCLLSGFCALSFNC